MTYTFDIIPSDLGIKHSAHYCHGKQKWHQSEHAGQDGTLGQLSADTVDIQEYSQGNQDKVETHLPSYYWLRAFTVRKVTKLVEVGKMAEN